jgi:glycosyltransferase involved in cell wall biosynthesis
MKRKVVFLYTELAAYFISCVKELAKCGVEVHIVRLPVNAEAPFIFEEQTDIFLYERNAFDETTLIHWLQNLNPDIILVSGWIDSAYLKACDAFIKKIPRVLLMDNQWKGTWKQRLAIALDPHKVKTRFSHVWVPGTPQANYALKMGFRPDQIRTGFYSADTDLFSTLYRKDLLPKSNKLLFVGRYLPFKGIANLWSAFAELSALFPNWELICIGTGDEWENRKIHPKIKHIGFVQPNQLASYISDAAFFVMPSEKEPWGVVMHEMAAAGLPIIATTEVGAASAFLEHEKNGFLIPPKNFEALKNALKMAMQVSPEQYAMMQLKSRELASKLSPAIWSRTLLNLMEESILSKHD